MRSPRAPRAPRASGCGGRGQAFPDFNQHHPLSETLMSAPDGSEFQSTHPGNGNRACPAQSKSSLTMNFQQHHLVIPLSFGASWSFPSPECSPSQPLLPLLFFQNNLNTVHLIPKAPPGLPGWWTCLNTSAVPAPDSTLIAG